LKPAGYHTWWTGKNHAHFNPFNRGYDHYYGMIGGAQNHFNPGDRPIAPGLPSPASKGKGATWAGDAVEMKKFVPNDPKFYDTDEFTNRALQWMDETKDDSKPFLLYVAYTAPHWPLQAWPEDIAKYKGVYDKGFEAVRQARYKRQIELGLVDPITSPLAPLEAGKKKKNKNEEVSLDPLKEAKSMEIYAAMVDSIDQNIGRMVKKLEAQGKLENTLIMFLADNGGCAEGPQVDNADPNAPLGSVASFVSYGANWAAVSNTPLRKYKTDSFEGGIRTPLIIHWPAGLPAQSGWNREPAHLIDILPTLVSVSGAQYPGASKEKNIAPMDGTSLLPAFKGQPIARKNPIYFQFSKGSAIREGQWKLVRDTETWELYNMDKDSSETHNLAEQYPEVVKHLDTQWLAWWKNCTGSAWTGQVPKEKAD
jgi:arylsulfatase A-like enzyme